MHTKNFGGPLETRTPDPLIKSPQLYNITETFCEKAKIPKRARLSIGTRRARQGAWQENRASRRADVQQPTRSPGPEEENREVATQGAPVAGVYSSVLLKILPAFSPPPAISTLPLGSRVAVAPERPVFIVGSEAAGAKLLVVGS